MPLIIRHPPAPHLQYLLLFILVIIHTSHCSRDGNARTTQQTQSLQQQRQHLNDQDNLPHPHLEIQPPHKQPKDANQQRALNKGSQNTASRSPSQTHHQPATPPSSPQQAAHFHSPIHNSDPQPNEASKPLLRTSTLSHPPPSHDPAQSIQRQQQSHRRQPKAASSGSDGASNATPLPSPSPTTDQSSSKVKSTASGFKNSVTAPFDTFRTPGSNPFTFGGFPFGFGGLSVTTAGQLDDLFVRAIYNRLFNYPFYGYVSQALPNQLTRPIELLPPGLRSRTDRTVVTPVGYDLLDRFSELFVKGPVAVEGALVPAGCVGPIFSFGVQGGNCSVNPSNGTVICTQPSVRLTASPLTCNLPYRSGCSFGGIQFRKRLPLGPTAGGYLGPPPGLYETGVSVNMTRVWLGFNLNAAKVLNDFGVIRWYAYLLQFLSTELRRVSRTLVSPRYNFTEAILQAYGRDGSGSTTSGGSGASSDSSSGTNTDSSSGASSDGGGEGDTGSLDEVIIYDTTQGANPTTSFERSSNRGPQDELIGSNSVPKDVAVEAADAPVQLWTQTGGDASGGGAAGAAGSSAGSDNNKDGSGSGSGKPLNGLAADGGTSLGDVLSHAATLAGWRRNSTLMGLIMQQVLGRPSGAQLPPSAGGGDGTDGGRTRPSTSSTSTGGDNDQYAQGTVGDTFNVRGDTPEALHGTAERDATGRRVARGSTHDTALLTAMEQQLSAQLDAAAARSRLKLLTSGGQTWGLGQGAGMGTGRLRKGAEEGGAAATGNARQQTRDGNQDGGARQGLPPLVAALIHSLGGDEARSGLGVSGGPGAEEPGDVRLEQAGGQQGNLLSWLQEEDV